MGAVLATRLDLQQRLGEMITGSLAAPAAPFRVVSVVQLTMRGEMRDIVQRDDTPDSLMQIGASRAMKLPGLGVIDKPLQGVAAPDISVKIPGRKSAQVTRSLDIEVSRMAVHLLVDGRMPPDRREAIKRMAAEFAGVETSRGDTVDVADLPAAAVPAELAPTITVNTREGGFPWQLAVICVAVLLAAAMLAVAIGRRAGGGDRFSIETGGGRRDDVLEGEDLPEGGVEPGAGLAPRDVRSGPRAFAFLADATPDEMAELAEDLDPATTAVVLDQVGLGDAAAKRLFQRISKERQLEIGVALGAGRIVPRASFSDMEKSVEEALTRVRSRVSVGGPKRLAEFLAQAPESSQKDILEGITSRNPALAEAIRDELVLFEDLAQIPEPAIRQVVTAVGDPATVALALVGAPEAIREAVLRSVSKRLKGIIEVEAETLQEKPADEIGAARKSVEQAMRRLQLRGEIKAKAREARAA